jgi:AraC-like DNA-binding protein
MSGFYTFVAMKYIFLIAVFNALLFIVFLLQKRPRALHDNILTCWLTYLGFFIGIYAFYSHELFTHYKLLSISLISLFLLHGPFLYLYIQTLISNKLQLSWKDLLHLLPFILFNLYILAASLQPVASEKLNIEKLSGDFNPPFLFLFFLILTAFSGTLYFILTIRLFGKLDIRIFNNYSSLAGIDLKWLRLLVLAFGVVWTILICVTVIHHVFNMFSAVFCTDGLFVSLSAFVILIGYFGLKQKVIFSSEDIETSGESSKPFTKYAGSRLTESEAQQYSERLAEYMKSSRPYLNPDLTLSQLAGELDISSHFLSQVINEKFGLNFFDFINGYRVEEFKERVSDPGYSNFSLLGIALECGFNSKSAFNRIFKQKTGLTPSQFKKIL